MYGVEHHLVRPSKNLLKLLKSRPVLLTQIYERLRIITSYQWDNMAGVQFHPVHHGFRAGAHVLYSVFKQKRRSNSQQINKWNFALP